MSARKTTRRSSKGSRKSSKGGCQKAIARVPMSGWTCLRDDLDEKWVRRAADGSYYFVCAIDMWEATGDEDQEHYIAEVQRVVLDEVSAEDKKRAMESCGLPLPKGPSDDVMAECVQEYGIHQPLGTFSDSDSVRAREAARRAAEEYMGDDDALDERLERPVNQIGTTAREFGRGDINAGLHRHRSEPNEDEPGDDEEPDEPWFPEGESDVHPPFPVPMFPGTEHPGFKYICNLFVDSSGYGSAGESAMTYQAFVAWVRQAIRDGKEYGYGITDAGPFQVNIGVYERDASAARGERDGAGGTSKDRARLQKLKTLAEHHTAMPGEAASAKARVEELESKLRGSKPKRGRQPKRRRVVPATVAFPGGFSVGAVPSNNPLAYMMGFKDGWSMNSEPAKRYFDDKADAYNEAFKLGRKVRAGEMPVPPWVKV